MPIEVISSESDIGAVRAAEGLAATTGTTTSIITLVWPFLHQLQETHFSQDTVYAQMAVFHLVFIHTGQLY